MSELVHQTFFDAMLEKFQLRARGECHVCKGMDRFEFVDDPCSNCNGTGKENRSLTPWKDYDWQFLWGRLRDELRELDKAMGRVLPREIIDKKKPFTDAAADELLDIANFAAFLWLKWKGENS